MWPHETSIGRGLINAHTVLCGHALIDLNTTILKGKSQKHITKLVTIQKQRLHLVELNKSSHMVLTFQETRGD